jgi:hypothetical protein
MAIFYCLILDSPNLEVQVPVFLSPRNRVAQLYPRALGSLFVASYDSQGYSGSILTRLHTGQRKSAFFYITYINSVRTSQETQYISVLQPRTLTTRPHRRSLDGYILGLISYPEY